MKDATKRLRGRWYTVEGRPDLLHPAGIHHHDAISQRHGLDLIVRHVHHRRPELPVQRRDLATQLQAELRVEVRQRLVEQKDLRLAHDGPSDGHALPLPTGELSRPVLQHVRQAENGRGAFHRDPGSRRAIACGALKAKPIFSNTVMCGYNAYPWNTMATSRSRGGRSLTMRSPMDSRPDEMDSSPAIIRSVVDFPHPDGPTSTTNSPSATSRSRPWTATKPESAYTLRTLFERDPGHQRSPLRRRQRRPPAAGRGPGDASARGEGALTTTPSGRGPSLPVGAPFPPGFLWGAATSAYQVEGSPLADGAGASTWHRFAHTPGVIRDGATGDIACDHYHRFHEDVALMRAIGLTAYRFSISWSRVMPTGRRRVNARGLGFYERLVDALLASNIQPLVTLYHWDLPAALDDRGGWLNPDSPHWFAEYADLAFRTFDDRVAWWVTINEPGIVVDRGYLHGVHAPGHRNAFEAPRAAHHLLLAHGEAVVAYRATGRHRIGIALNLEPQYAASKRAADRAAAARADAYINRHYLDPVLRGVYPDELRTIYGPAWPGYAAAEVEPIRQPIDFLGINYYSRRVVRADDAAYPTRARAVRRPRAPHTEMGWEIYPAGLRDVLHGIRDRYGEIPLLVGENGAAFRDPPTAGARGIDDRRRSAYLRDHLRVTLDALRSGIDLRGYFVWSLLDNFEWGEGLSKRFGLIHVDYASQRRTVKASARSYGDVIRTNGAVLRSTPSRRHS